MKIAVGYIYEVLPVFSKIGNQEMELAQAVEVANTIESITKHLNDLEPRRLEIVELEKPEDESLLEVWEKERAAALQNFSKEEVEIPLVNFKNLEGLRLSPNDILILKGAGIYSD